MQMLACLSDVRQIQRRAPSYRIFKIMMMMLAMMMMTNKKVMTMTMRVMMMMMIHTCLPKSASVPIVRESSKKVFH